jgi:hypothetical protein
VYVGGCRLIAGESAGHLTISLHYKSRIIFEKKAKEKKGLWKVVTGGRVVFFWPKFSAVYSCL